jgi:hypothetical protein
MTTAALHGGGGDTDPLSRGDFDTPLDDIEALFTCLDEAFAHDNASDSLESTFNQAADSHLDLGASTTSRSGAGGEVTWGALRRAVYKTTGPLMVLASGMPSSSQQPGHHIVSLEDFSRIFFGVHDIAAKLREERRVRAVVERRKTLVRGDVDGPAHASVVAPVLKSRRSSSAAAAAAVFMKRKISRANPDGPGLSKDGALPSFARHASTRRVRGNDATTGLHATLVSEPSLSMAVGADTSHPSHDMIGAGRDLPKRTATTWDAFLTALDAPAWDDDGIGAPAVTANERSQMSTGAYKSVDRLVTVRRHPAKQLDGTMLGDKPNPMGRRRSHALDVGDDEPTPTSGNLSGNPVDPFALPPPPTSSKGSNTPGATPGSDPVLEEEEVSRTTFNDSHSVAFDFSGDRPARRRRRLSDDGSLGAVTPNATMLQIESDRKNVLTMAPPPMGRKAHGIMYGNGERERRSSKSMQRKKLLMALANSSSYSTEMEMSGASPPAGNAPPLRESMSTVTGHISTLACAPLKKMPPPAKRAATPGTGSTRASPHPRVASSASVTRRSPSASLIRPNSTTSTRSNSTASTALMPTVKPDGDNSRRHSRATPDQRREAANDKRTTRTAERTVVQPHRFAVLRHQLNRSAAKKTPLGKATYHAPSKVQQQPAHDDPSDDDDDSGYSSDSDKEDAVLEGETPAGRAVAKNGKKRHNDDEDEAVQMSLWLQSAGTRTRIVMDDQPVRRSKSALD